MSLLPRPATQKNVQPGTPKAAGTSTMQTLRGQPATLGGVFANFISWSFWQYSRWIDSIFFTKRRARRLKIFDLPSRNQAAHAHLDCGQLSDCNRQLCQKLILSGESMYGELCAPNQDYRWGSFAKVTLMAIELKTYPSFAQYQRALAKRSGNFIREVN